MKANLDTELLYLTWCAARRMETFPEADLSLSFGAYLLKHGVSETELPAPDAAPSIDQIEREANRLGRARVRRALVRSSWGASSLTDARLSYLGAVLEVSLSDGFGVETGANSMTYRAPACLVCGVALIRAETGRPLKYCRPACRMVDYRRRKATR